MSLDADAIVAKRKLRKRVSLWRALAIGLGIITVIALAFGSTGLGFDLGKRVNHVARIKVTGLITGDDRTLEMLRKIEKAKQVKGLLVHIDSPGGTTAGSEAIYERLRAIAKNRPVVAVMDTVAASGGYITAIAADHIVARGNTITGSVGVIFQWTQVKELLGKIGVKMQERKSGTLKAEPNMFDEPSAEVLAVTDAMINDSFIWFTDLVKDRRKLSSAQITLISDGRVFTGRQALDAKLIDTIGGEDEAREWMKAEHKVGADLKAVDWEPEPLTAASGIGLFGLKIVANWFGLADAMDVIDTRSPRLDGLLVLWHPQLQ
jgi:protease-4